MQIYHKLLARKRNDPHGDLNVRFGLTCSKLNTMLSADVTPVYYTHLDVYKSQTILYLNATNTQNPAT